MTTRDATRLLVTGLAVAVVGALATIPVLSVAATGTTIPVIRTAAAVMAVPSAGWWTTRRQLHGRVRELETEVAELRLDLARRQALAVENRELRKLLELPKLPGWHRIAARVLARDPVSWDRRLRIGKGAVDGVVVGAVVLRGTEVIGRVTEVGGRTALISTVLDPACRLSVRLQSSGAVGVLGGAQAHPAGGRRVCLVEHLSADAAYTVAEAVVTSGLSEFVPGGLRVGRLVAWEGDDAVQRHAGGTARGKVRPAADLSAVRHVSVLVVGAG